MLPKEVVDVLLKYESEVAEEISNINLAVDKIKCQLKTVSSILVGELVSYAKNTQTKYKEKELELLQDSQVLREYISTIQDIKFLLPSNNTIEEKKLDIYNVIILSNTLKCSFSNHNTMDVKVCIPVLYSTGDIHYISVLASYCATCNRYTILKDTFKRITGVIMCEVVDNTLTIINPNTDDDIDIKQKESLLYRYGYNVKSKLNLSLEQRHIILSSLVEADIFNRRQIIDHLSVLIERGSKIPKWKEATDKWKCDKSFIEKYKADELPDVIFEKIILKYSQSKE